MDLGSTLLWVGICILFEAFFSGTELAVISLNRVNIQKKADEGNTSAQKVQELLKNPERIFSTTSLGTNLAVVTSTSLFAAFMVNQFAEKGDMYATLILSPIILFGGEIVPKLIVSNRANSTILVLVHPLNFFCKIFTPVLKVFGFFTELLLKPFKGLTEYKNPLFSRDQIQQVVGPGSQSTDLGVVERKIIHKIFNFGEITVEQCMVPLVQVVAIKDTATLEESHELANSSEYSRLPVFHERMFNMTGILNTFDLINLPIDNTPITNLIRPAYYVPPNKKIDGLLKGLQKRGLHMAIVVDEYGGCIGIITIEDVLEEIVGEIEDEFDKPEKLYKPYSDGGYLIDGEMGIDSINEDLGLNLPKGDYETLGGLIIEKLEKIPSPGEQVTVEGYRLTVKDTSKRKINSIIVREIKNNGNQDAG